MGAGAFVGIRHLGGENGLELGRRHSGPGQDTIPLHLGRRRHHDHCVDVLFAAGLQQKGDVQHHHIGLRRPGAFEELRPCGAHQRPDQAIEPGEGLGVAEHPFGQQAAVDTAALHHPRESRLDKGHGRPARGIEAADLGVGVVDRCAGVGEHLGGRGLAHADRTGQSHDDHRSASRAATASARTLIAGGGRPKKRSKLGRAWPISIASPSTVRRPRAWAASRKTVRIGR
jgi:hypothetical protein